LEKKEKTLLILGIITSSIFIITLIILLISMIRIENDPTSYIVENTINIINTDDTEDENIEDKSEKKDSNDIDVEVSIYDASLEDLYETVIVDSKNFKDKKYPLLASLPDKNIFLYGADDGVILRQDNIIKPFEWVYLTPRFVLPRLFVADLDEDGVEEIICILYVASGTGISIDELHILEPDEDHIYRDIMFSPKDYIQQINDAIQIQYDSKKNKFYYNVLGTEYEEIGTLEFLKYTYKETVFGNMLYYDYDGDLILNIAPEYNFYGLEHPLLLNSISAKVNYRNESFTLSDMVISLPE